MIKLIIFDLDGVLVDAKEIHYKALNDALCEIGDSYVISEQEHLSLYDGLKTRSKLDLLSERKGLPRKTHNQIWERKQKITAEAIESLQPNDNLISLFKTLRERDLKLACCSNSIRRSVILMLSKVFGIFFSSKLVILNPIL